MDLLINIMLCVLLSVFILYILIKIVIDIIEYKSHKRVNDEVENHIKHCIISLIEDEEMKKTDEDKTSTKSKAPKEESLEKMTLVALREIAKEKKIPKYYLMSKVEILDAIKKSH